MTQEKKSQKKVKWAVFHFFNSMAAWRLLRETKDYFYICMEDGGREPLPLTEMGIPKKVYREVNWKIR